MASLAPMLLPSLASPYIPPRGQLGVSTPWRGPQPFFPSQGLFTRTPVPGRVHARVPRLKVEPLEDVSPRRAATAPEGGKRPAWRTRQVSEYAATDDELGLTEPAEFKAVMSSYLTGLATQIEKYSAGALEALEGGEDVDVLGSLAVLGLDISAAEPSPTLSTPRYTADAGQAVQILDGDGSRTDHEIYGPGGLLVEPPTQLRWVPPTGEDGEVFGWVDTRSAGERDVMAVAAAEIKAVREASADTAEGIKKRKKDPFEVQAERRRRRCRQLRVQPRAMQPRIPGAEDEDFGRPAASPEVKQLCSLLSPRGTKPNRFLGALRNRPGAPECQGAPRQAGVAGEVSKRMDATESGLNWRPPKSSGPKRFGARVCKENNPVVRPGVLRKKRTSETFTPASMRCSLVLPHSKSKVSVHTCDTVRHSPVAKDAGRSRLSASTFAGAPSPVLSGLSARARSVSRHNSIVEGHEHIHDHLNMHRSSQPGSVPGRQRASIHGFLQLQEALSAEQNQDSERASSALVSLPPTS